MRLPVLSKLKDKTIGFFNGRSKVLSLNNKTSDQVNINLWGLNLSVKRDTTLDIPSEMSVIIPRVEFRHKYTSSPAPSCETEIILNSITVILAPRHPSEQK